MCAITIQDAEAMADKSPLSQNSLVVFQMPKLRPVLGIIGSHL
jgi:hypothetical protein